MNMHKKVILELDPALLQMMGYQDLLSKIEYIEGMDTFKIETHSASESGICKVKLKKGINFIDLEPVTTALGMTIEPLGDKDGIFVCFFKAKLEGRAAELLKSINADLVYSLPFYLSSKKVILSFFGDSENIKSFLDTLKNFGIIFKVVSLQKPSQENTLSSLTERQKEILTTAKNKGYYDTPRKVSSQQLANHFGISTATLLEHLRKAEKKVIDSIFAFV
jgi:DNA-binding CsgD family transcriptional regulator